MCYSDVYNIYCSNLCIAIKEGLCITILLRDEFVGNFAYNYDKNYVSGVLLKLDIYDINHFFNSIRLKDDEILLRYVSDRMFINGKYYQKPLIKINTVKGLLYHLSEESNYSSIPVIFEGRGNRLSCLNLIVSGVYNKYMKDCINHLQICHDKTLEMQNNGDIYNYNIT